MRPNSRRRNLPLGILLSVLPLAAATSALAQQQPIAPPRTAGSITDWTITSRASDLSVLAWAPWYYGFGFGAQLRYEVFVLPTGFIPTLNDSFSLEPSIGLAYTSYWVPHYAWNVTDIAPALYGNWSFYFSRAFRLYLALGLGYNIGIATAPVGYVGGGIADSFFYWDLAFGLSYKFSKAVAFRGELGSQGAKAGISIYF
jgi:hypothetical protein